MWVALSGDGQMTRAQMLNELQTDRVCPILTYVSDGQALVPLFATADLAFQFAKRNTPRDYSVGVMEVDDEDKAALVKDGFAFEVLDWPKKKDTAVHVLTLNKEVATHACGYRNTVKAVREET